jgi:beta-fructofuranosidase
MWECPNFFALGEAGSLRHVLMISPMDLHPSRSLYTLAMLGDFSDNRFVPATVVKVDGGDVSFYAPQVFRDEKGRRISIGWAREARSVDASIAAGWAGVMTLPRVLGLGSDGVLTQQPVPEVDLLRGESVVHENILLEPGAQNLTYLDGVSGDTLELNITFDLAQTGSPAPGDFGLFVRRSPDGEEQTEIRVDCMAGRLVVDTMRSSLNRDVEPGQFEIPLDISGSGRVDLRVFLDRSVIEVYANDRAVITARIYPTRDDSTGIALFANHRPVRVQKLQSYQMTSIW